MSSSPSITFMLQYTEPNVRYVDYTNRDEAISIDNELNLENHRQTVEGLTEDQVKKIQAEVPETTYNFQEYIDYMNRSYATERQTEEVTAIFTQDANYLQRSKLSELKNKLQQAHQNGSLLWQGVISFDNAFLAKEGLYDVETGKVDQQALKSVIREAMPRMIEKEGLSETAFWWANIHLNTDNIHVHFGLSEVESAREKIFYRPRGRMEYRGNFSQKTLERMKSDVFHGLINEQTRGMLVRKEQILANLRTQLIDTVFRDNQVRTSAEKNFLEQAYNHLPAGKNWRYGSNAKDFAVSKFFLDRYLDSYLQHEGKELYQEFLQETRAFLKTYEGVYSAEKNLPYEKIRQVDGRTVRSQETSQGYELDRLVARRESELRERLANKVLRTFREETPHIADVRLEKNLAEFSAKNQELILKQFPEASVLKSLKSWQKLGYQLKPDEQGIEIIVPRYAFYDKYGHGIGRPEFVTEAVYDVSQMEEQLMDKQLTLKDLSFLSTVELKDLVDAAKKKADKTLKERQELGTFRYALKLSRLEEKKSELLVKQQLVSQVTPIDTDRPFVALKQRQFSQELKLVDLQLTPNYQLSPEELERKQMLSRQFVDSVSFPISKAKAGNIQLPIRRLREEIATVAQLQDEGILTIIKGQPITKQRYLEELQTQVSIFQLKHQIYKRNQKMDVLSDDEQIKGLKIENAEAFSELKKLYKTLERDGEQQTNQIAQVVAKQLQSRRQLKKANQQQSQGKAVINTDFMKQLTSSLNSAQRANKKALQDRERSDARQEQEEKEQGI